MSDKEYKTIAETKNPYGDGRATKILRNLEKFLMDKKMKFDVCVIGLGYIGLPTAAVIASNGLKVCGVDINKDVIEKINLGKIHIVEPGLE